MEGLLEPGKQFPCPLVGLADPPVVGGTFVLSLVDSLLS